MSKQPINQSDSSNRKPWEEPRIILERSLEAEAQGPAPGAPDASGPFGPFGPLTS
ncbi:MAG: hypothetical protein U9R25_05250 [Chloroflexota bacterium]|nr:hypothetical protein [Chloroflexota bacterium]